MGGERGMMRNTVLAVAKPRHSSALLASDLGSGELVQPWRAIAISCVLLAMAMVVVDAAIVNVALPTISKSFKVSPANAVLVVSAYQAGLVMALLPCAALGESLGLRRVFTVGMAIFLIASALCAISPSLSWLVAARFLQGLGGAAIMALGVALLRFAVSEQQFGAAISWNAMTVALCSAAGPALGAAILWGAGWQWLFALNIPFGGIALLATRALPVVAGNGQRLDWTSVALAASSVALLVSGAELIGVQFTLAIMLLLAALPLTAMLIRRESCREAPMIPVDLLRDRSFRLSVIASVSCFAGQAAAMVALPFHLQHALGQTPLMTGLTMTPWPLAVAVAAPLAGRLANRVSTARLCTVGGALLAVGLCGMALWPTADPSAFAALGVICGAGFGLFQVPNNRSMFLAAARERSAAAGGMQGTARLTGQTVGALIMTLLLMLTTINTAPRIGFAIGAILTLAAGIVSTLRIGSPR